MQKVFVLTKRYYDEWEFGPAFSSKEDALASLAQLTPEEKELWEIDEIEVLDHVLPFEERYTTALLSDGTVRRLEPLWAFHTEPPYVPVHHLGATFVTGADRKRVEEVFDKWMEKK